MSAFFLRKKCQLLQNRRIDVTLIHEHKETKALQFVNVRSIHFNLFFLLQLGEREHIGDLNACKHKHLTVCLYAQMCLVLV